MIDYLEFIDRQIVLFINGLHFPFLDHFMWLVSGKLTWIPLYFFIIIIAYKKLGVKTFSIFLALLLISIGLSDFISSQILKESIARYRPSHNLLLRDQLHFYENKPGEFYRGGQYGFVSSHAANFFAIACFVLLSLKKYVPWFTKWLLPIAILVAFSRIYLGVHYLSDVFVGGLVGASIAFLLYRYVYLRVVEK